MRVRTIIAAASLVLALSGCSQADNGSASTTASDAVIVVPYTIEAGKSRADAVKAIGDIGASIKSQPGFVHAQLLEETAPNVAPQFMHVTRWRSFKDWDALSGSPEFQQVLNRSLPSVRVNLAQVYKPVAKQ